MRAVVNSKYVVLNLRWLLRNIENTCVACRKRKARTVTHIMADLPIERLGYKQAPFTNTGVDYFGPFLVPILPEKYGKEVGFFVHLSHH